MTDQTSANSIISRALGRTRLTVAATMVVERGWPLLLPLLVIISVFLSLSWLGVFRMLPDLPRFGLVALIVAIGLAALYPLRFFRTPTASEIDRRIERANDLAHTPVLVQTDRPSGANTPFAEALWREHQRRMAASLERVRGDLPRTGVPERDPYGLRAGAALLVVTAFAFSFGPMGGRITDGFTTTAALEAVPARIDAWVTPPAYTGKAPVFLTAEASVGTPSFTVPAGSEVSLRVTGGAGDETLIFTDATGATREIVMQGTPADGAASAPAKEAASAVRQFAGKLEAGGTLSLRSGEDELQDWAFQVIPDTPPVIRFVGEPKRAANGAFEVAYEIEDDYGAANAEAEIVLAEPQAVDARALYPAPELKLVMPRRDAKNAARTVKDLTEHVWSGSSVQLTLKTVDAAGQEARSETKTVTLPEKPFANPLARAVVEHRKILSLDANRKTDVRDLIDAITLRPEDTIKNASHYLGLMAGRTMLNLAASDDEMRGVADYFWQMALTIEDGGLSDAEKALRQAQEALKQALENGASDEEISNLMQELRQAMNEYLRQFAEQARKNPNMAQQMPSNAQELRQSDLQRMLDQIENLAKSGNKEQAQELLSQLQEMMNNLQAGQPQQGQQGQQNSEMRQQMDKLGEIMRRQQEMMNETYRMDQMQRGENGQQGQNGEGQQPGQQGGQSKPMTPQEFAEALKQLQQGQGQLQGDLNALMKGLQGLGIEPGEGFGEAGKEMGNAEGSLGQGEGGRAVGEQGRALEALRKGAQDMMQQMQQAMQGEQGGSEQGGRQQNADRDPLGRPKATTGPDFSDSVKVPDEIDVQRARQILDAIRKRLGNALSPALEREYLERLLEMR